MTARGFSAYQIAWAMVRREVRGELVDMTDKPEEFGSVVFRATAALYELLLEHAVDRHGRCWKCRRAGSRIGPARRRCRVYPVAQYWLGQSGTALATTLVRELGLPALPSPGRLSRTDWTGLTITGRTSPDHPDNDVMPQTGTTPFRVSSSSLSPAVSSAAVLPGGVPQVRRPVPDHGGAGEPTPTEPRPRRGPSEDADDEKPPPVAGRSLLLSTGAA